MSFVETTTATSATDRCNAINLLSNPKSASADFARKGHIFPLHAKPKGVMESDGHTEVTVDLMKFLLAKIIQLKWHNYLS